MAKDREPDQQINRNQFDKMLKKPVLSLDWRVLQEFMEQEPQTDIPNEQRRTEERKRKKSR